MRAIFFFFFILTHSFICAATMNYTVLKLTGSELRGPEVTCMGLVVEKHGVPCMQVSLMYD